MDVARAFALLLAAVILLAACGPWGPEGDGTSPHADGDVVQESQEGRFERFALGDVAIWRHAQPGGDGLTAELAGVVGYDGDCGAFLELEDPDLRYPVVWPHGTTVAERDPVRMRLPDGAIVEIGQRVSGAGGYLHELHLFDEACAPTGETAVFNASDRTSTAGRSGALVQDG